MSMSRELREVERRPQIERGRRCFERVRTVVRRPKSGWGQVQIGRSECARKGCPGLLGRCCGRCPVTVGQGRTAEQGIAYYKALPTRLRMQNVLNWCVDCRPICRVLREPSNELAAAFEA